MYTYTWFYNPAVFNQQTYDQFVAEQRMREYEWKQNEAVVKACKAFTICSPNCQRLTPRIKINLWSDAVLCLPNMAYFINKCP